MPEVLAEPFRVFHASGTTLLGGPSLHRIDQTIDAVVLAEPVPLAFVAFEHSRFIVDHRRDIDAKCRNDLLAEKIFAFERVAVIRVRDRIDRRVFVSAVKKIWNRGGECRGPYDFARLFVVEVVIVRAVREYDFRADAVDEPYNFLQNALVENHSQVALFDAVIRRTDRAGGSGPLGTSNAGDLVGVVFGRTAVAGRHRRDVDFKSMFPLQPNERARTQKLRIVRMSDDRENDGSHKRFTLCAEKFGLVPIAVILGSRE